MEGNKDMEETNEGSGIVGTFEEIEGLEKKEDGAKECKENDNTSKTNKVLTYYQLFPEKIVEKWRPMGKSV